MSGPLPPGSRVDPETRDWETQGMALPREYESLGSFDADWHPSSQEVKRQAEMEAIAAWARQRAMEAPPLSERQKDVIRRSMSERPTPDELMVWRVRLFCGHETEKKAHRTHFTVQNALYSGGRCPTCGLEPATIVAAKAMHLASETEEAPPPGPPRPSPSQPVRRPTRAELEIDVVALRERVAMLERESRETEVRPE